MCCERAVYSLAIGVYDVSSEVITASTRLGVTTSWVSQHTLKTPRRKVEIRVGQDSNRLPGSMKCSVSALVPSLVGWKSEMKIGPYVKYNLWLSLAFDLNSLNGRKRRCGEHFANFGASKRSHSPKEYHYYITGWPESIALRNEIYMVSCLFKEPE